MLWNIRKKKFIVILVLGFVLALVGLVLPSMLSNIIDQPITANPDYAVMYSIPAFVIFFFALAVAMNSISSEFEMGTIVPLLTKPVSRTMVFLGKLFATFIVILTTYAIFFVIIIIGGSLVFGAQNNLHLVPLELLGNVVATFIWASIILAIGSLSKNTLISAIVAFALFGALFFAVPIVSAFVGPSATLNFVPGSGATGAFNTTLETISIGAGTDNLGTNLVNWALYPSANVDFIKMNIQIQDNQLRPITQTVAYTEPISLVALRSLGVAFAYIAIFLFIAWVALKKAQILE